jgi:hypothetical protein
MRINKLDLAKTISDFMFLGWEDFEERAKELFILKHTLDDRGHGFEKYIQYYFKNFHGYTVELNGRTNEQDWWIDLKWIRTLNGKAEYLVVQCKQHRVKDISYNDVSHFYWKIARAYLKHEAQSNVYYITTTKFSKKAKDYLEEEWVKAIDFEKISELQKIYPLNDFKKDILKEEWEKEAWKCFQKEQLILDLDDNIINTIEAGDKDVYELMRQVRRDISNNYQLRLWDIARNDTLEILVKKRPHNLEALKRATSHLWTREKNKLDKYWALFVERLKYVHQEETKEEVSVMKRLLGFLG